MQSFEPVFVTRSHSRRHPGPYSASYIPVWTLNSWIVSGLGIGTPKPGGVVIVHVNPIHSKIDVARPRTINVLPLTFGGIVCPRFRALIPPHPSRWR